MLQRLLSPRGEERLGSGYESGGWNTSNSPPRWTVGFNFRQIPPFRNKSINDDSMYIYLCRCNILAQFKDIRLTIVASLFSQCDPIVTTIGSKYIYNRYDYHWDPGKCHDGRADLWTRGERIWAGIDIEADLSRRKGDTPGSDRIGSDRRNERSNTGVAVEV